MRVALVCGLGVLIVSGVILAERLEDTFYVPLDDPAIQYAGPASDPIARLEKQLEIGKAKLDYAPNGWGYLPSVLKQLDINIDSQALVFSRTSIQNTHISPRTPRAIYFNDDTAVGFVQNGDVLELSGIDPRQGAVFYSLDTEKSDRPEFARRDDCLRCHQGAPTMGIPGNPGELGASRSRMPKRARRTEARSLPTIAPVSMNAGAGGTSPARTGPRCIWEIIWNWPIRCFRAGRRKKARRT